MSHKIDDAAAPPDDYANRRGRRKAHRHTRQWVGEVDADLLDEFEETDAVDEPPKFERLRSRRKGRYED